ncbi:MAG: signal peptidase I, partial [Armatimonadota bacterium]
MHQIALHTTGRRAPSRVARVVADRLKLVLLATTVVLLAKTLLLDIVVVQGGSMEPALCSGDYVLVEKLTPRLGLVRPGQIVVLKAGSPETLMVKRVVATGGDEVELRPGQIIVNGRSTPKGRRTASGTQRRARLLVPDGHLFVLGDNGPLSDDSEDFGPVPTANVSARVVAGLASWAGAGSSGITVFTCAAGSEGAGGRLGSRATAARVIAGARAAMEQVEAAHVVAGGEQIWISEDYGVRRQIGPGFALYTDEATWRY